MAKHIVWLRGVDFDETFYDTQKLSIIRGASRALEEMPELAADRFRALDGGLIQIAGGASQAGFLLDADGAQIQAACDRLVADLRTRGREPDDVQKLVRASERDEFDLGQLKQGAPFAHLRFHAAVEAVDGDADGAIARARAAIALKSMREPGVRHRFARDPGLEDGPCKFDRLRPAEIMIKGPPQNRDDEKKRFSEIAVSRSSGARWHFGRVLRQRLYERARENLRAEGDADKARLVFVDDFHEMVGAPWPYVPKPGEPKGELGDLPVSIVNKIAVFYADGDGFGALRDKLQRKSRDPQDGAARVLGRMSDAVKESMGGLLTRLVLDLATMRDGADRNAKNAAVLDLSEEKAIRNRWIGRRDDDKLLRFETLLFGGDEATFVVPAWLGWWLAVAFFQETSTWEIDGEPLRFSAGLVFASYKTPIRSLRNLATDLCRIAKQADGGLEIEALESVEPPEEGVRDLRTRLLGQAWAVARTDGGTRGPRSRLTIPRAEIADTYRMLWNTWVSEQAFPTSQAHRALRKAREAGERDDSLLAGTTAAKAAEAELARYSLHDGNVLKAFYDDAGFLREAAGAQALRLHMLLQQRDYVIAAAPWIKSSAAMADHGGDK